MTIIINVWCNSNANNGKPYQVHTKDTGHPYGKIFAGRDYLPIPRHGLVEEAIARGETSGSWMDGRWELVAVR